MDPLPSRPGPWEGLALTEQVPWIGGPHWAAGRVWWAGMDDDTANPAPLSPADVATALLSSDLAQEVRAEFEGRMAVGLPVPTATAHAFGRFRTALADPDDGPVVILALAALQWREGYVQAVIRDAAVDLIDSGEATAAYRSPDGAARRARAQLLDAFADVLRATAIQADGPDEGD